MGSGDIDRTEELIGTLRDEIVWLRAQVSAQFAGRAGPEYAPAISASDTDVCPATGLYLSLMKKCLTRLLFTEGHSVAAGSGKRVPRDDEKRAIGRDWPAEAETMVGMRRLDNIEFCVADVILRGVPGDLIETGVWRGGAAIFMAAVLRAHGERSRTVWAADSFAGLPLPNPERYPADKREYRFDTEFLAVSLEEVKANFTRYGLLDDQVRFLVGWFSETLPTAEVEQLAVLRLDGDLYESTAVALESLYPRLSVGGYAIVDDYGISNRACKKAVDDYRAANGITESLREIDWSGVYWQREH